MIVLRLVGILGLCAIVLSNPYEITEYMPEALTVLCTYSHDPDPMQVSTVHSIRPSLSVCPF